jgi:hypothetical protein
MAQWLYGGPRTLSNPEASSRAVSTSKISPQTAKRDKSERRETLAILTNSSLATNRRPGAIFGMHCLETRHFVSRARHLLTAFVSICQGLAAP